MDNEATVEPQEYEVDTEVGQDVPDTDLGQNDDAKSTQEPTMVPLSALQKERKKRQEIEQELYYERQRPQSVAPPPPQEEDTTRYESATREDLSKSQEEAIRIIEERLWIKQNPEKYEKVNDYLPNFLKQKPNLASAINSSSNRYEEAYTLMEALTPKQQQQLKATPPQKRDAPGSPSGVPKAAALNQVVDVMGMSDSEFSAWRQSQKKRR